MHTRQPWCSVLRSRQWPDHRESKNYKYFYINISLSYWGEVLEQSMAILYSNLDLWYVMLIPVALLDYRKQFIEESRKYLRRTFVWGPKAEKNNLKREDFVIINENVNASLNRAFKIVTFLPEFDSLHNKRRVTFTQPHKLIEKKTISYFRMLFQTQDITRNSFFVKRLVLVVIMSSITAIGIFEY